MSPVSGSGGLIGCKGNASMPAVRVVSSGRDGGHGNPRKLALFQTLLAPEPAASGAGSGPAPVSKNRTG